MTSRTGKIKPEPEIFTDFSSSKSPSLSQQQESSTRVHSEELNFQSPKFNTIDDLDDNTGNYRSFRSLEGIVTADMRYHEERKRNKAPSIEPAQEESATAGQEMPVEKDEIQQQLPPLLFSSKGRTLIISSERETALEYGEHLTGQGLRCTVCVPSSDNANPSLSRIGSLDFITTDAVAVSGSFCGFTVVAGNNGTQISLSKLFDKEFDHFDLVLDLQSEPSYTGSQLPTGYFYAPGNDQNLLEQALSELPGMKGRFTKPQFTIVHEKECIHGRSKAVECNRCLEICPVHAIRTNGQRITVDHYLCQGCGGCELVCPADAIRVDFQENFLSEIVTRLKHEAIHNDNPPMLVLYDNHIDDDNFQRERDDVIFFGVEEMASVGLHVPLVALACGAGSVYVVCGTSRPEKIRQEIKSQVELGRMILQQMDLLSEYICFNVHASNGEEENFILEDGICAKRLPLHTPANFSLEQDKRTLTRLAIQDLSGLSGKNQTFVSLPAGTPFGAVAVHPTACSLCMACVGICPSEALAASGDVPRISINEARCHQCGLCAAACPEDAIRLLPRILVDFESAVSPQILHEVEPFRCIECGEPFASQAMVNRMQEKLSTHWMYGSEQQIRRLEMCRACRTSDALLSGDYRR